MSSPSTSIAPAVGTQQARAAWRWWWSCRRRCRRAGRSCAPRGTAKPMSSTAVTLAVPLGQAVDVDDGVEHGRLYDGGAPPRPALPRGRAQRAGFTSGDVNSASNRLRARDACRGCLGGAGAPAHAGPDSLDRGRRAARDRAAVHFGFGFEAAARTRRWPRSPPRSSSTSRSRCVRRAARLGDRGAAFLLAGTCSSSPCCCYLTGGLRTRSRS